MWTNIAPLSVSDELGRLAYGTAGAALFTLAFHNQGWIDLRKFSTGDYINPAANSTDLETLAGFAATSQAHLRHAAMYRRVHQWQANADSLTNTQTEQADVTLDGVPNYLLYNRYVFAIFDQLGGRLLSAWVRDAGSGRVFQMMGNPLAYADGPTDEEGTNPVTARRTSGFKDTTAVNSLYTFTNWTNGWRATAGTVTKTITLPDNASRLEATYSVGASTVAVRHGLSPDLYNLLIRGQENLVVTQGAGRYRLANIRPDDVEIATTVIYADEGFTATLNGAATDRTNTMDTVNMRRQAQTEQVELSGTGTFSFAIEFEVQDLTQQPPQDVDGVPISWLDEFGYDPATVDVNTEMAANGINTLREAYIAGLNPTNSASVFEAQESDMSNDGFLLRWSSATNRWYHVHRSTNLMEGMQGFEPMVTNLWGTPPVNEYLDTNVWESGSYFYQIRVTLPNEE